MQAAPLSSVTDGAVGSTIGTHTVDLTAALGRLTRLLANRRVHGRLTAALGVDLSQQAMQVLGALDADVASPVGELARAAHMDVGAVSRQLRGLEERGLVTRTASPGNGSIVLVAATDEGRVVADQLATVRSSHLGEALSGWSEAEVAALAAQLDRLLDDLQATPYRALDSA